LFVDARGAAAFMLSDQKFFGYFFKKELFAFFLMARLGYGATIKAAGIVRPEAAKPHGSDKKPIACRSIITPPLG
jgi:hypothetical protein